MMILLIKSLVSYM
jgi:hypothetical protein